VTIKVILQNARCNSKDYVMNYKLKYGESLILILYLPFVQKTYRNRCPNSSYKITFPFKVNDASIDRKHDVL